MCILMGYSVEGCSAIVSVIKLHVKVKEKNCSEHETKRPNMRWTSIYKVFGSHNFQGLKND